MGLAKLSTEASRGTARMFSLTGGAISPRTPAGLSQPPRRTRRGATMRRPAASDEALPLHDEGSARPRISKFFPHSP